MMNELIRKLCLQCGGVEEVLMEINLKGDCFFVLECENCKRSSKDERS